MEAGSVTKCVYGRHGGVVVRGLAGGVSARLSERGKEAEQLAS